ncbi:MATE family efflux transporter [Thomasclavelia ramosa]
MKNYIFKDFLKYTSLNVLGMIGLSCYILADTFFIANGVGEIGLSALNLALPMYCLINGLGLMIGIGGGTRYSLLKVNSNRTSQNIIFSNALYFMLILAIIFVVLGLSVSTSLANLLGANQDTTIYTATYLKTIMFFAPMFMLNNLLIGFVRNDDNPRLAMMGMLIGSLTNVVLDYIFIFPFGLGMFGAALATGVAPVISISIMSPYVIKKANFKFLKTKLCLNHCKDIFLLGLSALIGELATGIVMLLFNFTLLKYSGNIGVAAYGIIANIAFVIVSMFTGVAQGIQPIISKNLSFKEYRNVNLAYHYGLWTVIIFAVIVYLSSYFAAAQIVALFNSSSNPELLDLAVRGIHIYFGGFIFAGVNMISATFFSASDKPRQAFIISSLRGFILIAPVIFILSTIFKVDGVWLTYVVTELITSIITIILKRKSDFSLH